MRLDSSTVSSRNSSSAEIVMRNVTSPDTATAATGSSMVARASLKRRESDDRGAGIWPMGLFSTSGNASLRGS